MIKTSQNFFYNNTQHVILFVVLIVTILSHNGSAVTEADWDSMGRVAVQAPGQFFQTLGQAFHFLLRLQKLSRVFKKLSQAFERLGRVF